MIDMGRLGGIDLTELSLFEVMYLMAFKKQTDPAIKLARRHKNYD